MRTEPEIVALRKNLRGRPKGTAFFTAGANGHRGEIFFSAVEVIGFLGIILRNMIFSKICAGLVNDFYKIL